MDSMQAPAWPAASALDPGNLSAASGSRLPASPDEPEEPAMPDDGEGPPGEHKHEPIDDPDPADTTMQRVAIPLRPK